MESLKRSMFGDDAIRQLLGKEFAKNDNAAYEASFGKIVDDEKRVVAHCLRQGLGSAWAITSPK